ncbi:MAG: ribonuclease P protein component [Fimbriimonadaceae bacterium]|nr:ribonuclease P protein component [Fimbriimonadaceae bacterium]
MRGLKPCRFEEIFACGSREVGEFTRIHALPGEGRIGFATSRSIGNRPRRNRVQRRLRAATPRVTSLDVVVLGQRNADRASFEEIKDELKKHLEALTQRWEKG